MYNVHTRILTNGKLVTSLLKIIFTIRLLKWQILHSIGKILIKVCYIRYQFSNGAS
jgi:hypothetical protein